MAVKVTGQFVPAGEFSIVDGKDISGNITGSNFSGSSSSTGSFGNLNISSDASVTGDMVVGGKLTAQEIHTEIESASIIFSSGSTKFGDTSDDIHRFTGSLKVTGSITATTLSGDGSGLTNVFENTAASSSISSRLTNLVSDSASFSTRISTAETELEETLVSASAQLADQISGSFTAPSASLSTRVTNLKSDSGSFSTRVTDLKSDSGSFSTRVTDLKSDSGSFSTRVTDLKTDSASFSSRITTAETELELTLISGSAQIATQISGAFDSVSSSLSSRLQIAETELENTLVSASAQLSDQISGSFTAPSSSFSTRVTKNEGTGSKILTGQLDFTNITATGAITASGGLQATTGNIKTQNSRRLQAFRNSGQYVELYSDPNGFNYLQPFGGALRFAPNGGTKMILHTNGRLGLNTTVDAGFLLDINGTSRLSDDVTLGGDISGSLTSTGSFGSIKFDNELVGSSFSTGSFGRITTQGAINIGVNAVIGQGLSIGGDTIANGNITAPSFTGIFNGALSGSAQIASNISGAFAVASASFASDINDLQADSGSFSTRVTNLKSDSGSFSTRVTDLKLDSGSFSTRVTNLKIDSGSLATRITNLKADSGSFSTRVTKNEGTGSKILNGQLEFTNITGSGHISMSILSTGSFGRVSATTIGGHSPLVVDSNTTFIHSITSSAHVSSSMTSTASFGRVNVIGLGGHQTLTIDPITTFTNVITASANVNFDSKIFIQTGSIEGDLHVRTNADLMRIGKSTTGLLVSGSGEIQRFATASNGDLIDLGFTVIDEDGNSVLAGDGDGIHVDDNNYWYNNKFYKVGNGSTKFLEYDAIDLKYKGQVFATTGSIDGEMYIKSPTGSMFIGKYTGGIPSSGSSTNIPRFATGSDGSIIDLGFTTTDEDGNTVFLTTGDGIVVDSNNYWYTTGHFKIGNSKNFINWNTSNLTISGTFVGDGSGLTGVSGGGGSSFTKAGISGSFTVLSSSFSSRLTTAEAELSLTLLSSSAQVKSLLPTNVVSSSKQIASNISGSITVLSSSLASRIKTLEAGGVTIPTNTVSSSAQLASRISGSFTALSASLAGRITSGGGGGGSDNLGNHTATQNLNLDNNAIINASNVSGSSTSTGSFGTIQMPGISIGNGTNTFFGKNAGKVHGNNGENNLAIGLNAMDDTDAGSTSLSSDENVFIGHNAGGGTWANNKSRFNVGVGNNSMAAAFNGALSNTALGYNSLNKLTEGSSNIAMGSQAGEEITTGDNNVCIGTGAGKETLATGNGNVLLGRNTDTSAAGSANQIVIGTDVTGTGDNQTVIGNSSQTHVIFGGDALISGSATSTGSFGTIQTTTGTIPTLIGDTTFSNNLTVAGNLDVADTIYHTGDSNTKIRFPEVDTIAFNTSGVERLRITSDGQISGSSTSTGSFGKLVVGDDIELVEDQRIYFEADKTTYIESHASDSFRAVVNDRQMLLLDEDTGNRAVFGNGTKVYIGADNNKQPDKELVVDGDISGSLTSTGSFGTLQSSTATIPSLLGDVTAGGKIVIDQNQPIEFHLTQGNRDRIIRDSTSNAMNMLSRANIGLIIDSNSDDTDAVFSVRMNGYTHAASTPLLTVTQQHEISGSSSSTGSFGRVAAVRKVNIGNVPENWAEQLNILGTTSTTGIKVQAPSSGNAQIKLYSNNGGSNNDFWYMQATNGGTFDIVNYGPGSFTNMVSIAANTGHMTVRGNVSGSATSTGSFGHIIGDGSGITNVTATLPSGVISGSSGNLTVTNTITATTGSISNIQTPLTGRVISNFTELIKVTVVSDGGSHYAFEGATAPSIQVSEGKTYRFDLSDGTLGPHPFRLSTTQDGSHNGGSSYTTGVTIVGSAGSAGAYLEIKVDKNTANALYYYCTAHGGMGNDGRLLKNDLMNLAAIKVTGNQVDFTNLPTSNPSVAGRLWNDSGTVKISSG